jgi:hypothetical protein
MAVYHSDITRNEITDLVVDKIDISGPGKLKFQNTAGTTISTLLFSNPAFQQSGVVGTGGGAATVGLAYANAIADSVCIDGIISKFIVTNGADVIVFGGTVSIANGGGNIILSSVDMNTGDTISVSALTYTAPA